LWPINTLLNANMRNMSRKAILVFDMCFEFIFLTYWTLRKVCETYPLARDVRHRSHETNQPW
jgi:hypothetical protein